MMVILMNVSLCLFVKVWYWLMQFKDDFQVVFCNQFVVVIGMVQVVLEFGEFCVIYFVFVMYIKLE